MSTITATDEQTYNRVEAFGYCQHQYFSGSVDFGPPEFCDEPANDDGFCAVHDDPDGDPDLAYELMRDDG